MISVAEALGHIFSLIEPVGTEQCPVATAPGRVLAEDGVARRDQPPFDASAMDGYAVADTGVVPGATFRVIGEAPAGRAYPGRVGPGEAVRIFTGAPLPEGGTRVVIQEDVEAADGRIVLSDRIAPDTHVRPRGGDFRVGDRVSAGRRLSAADAMLLASMNVAEVTVARRPVVAILATGDELVMPGEAPRPDQIVSSNPVGLAAIATQAGAIVRVLPIARDTLPGLRSALSLAAGADLIVTSGGASVGDHDLMASAAGELGLDRAFYKVAMRPGKPLMAGRIGGIPLIGLPGNPVSCFVCGLVFVAPAIAVLQGLPPAPAPRRMGILAAALPANGPREHYMRASMGEEGLTPATSQDSSLQHVLSQAQALIIRPPGDPARAAGEKVEFLPL